jgi:hypothetical protein
MTPDMENIRKFVVQKHQKESEPTHWDLMLESGDFLETYRLALPPEKWKKNAIEAMKIFDHPLKFLSYEGRVNKGKGWVKIADCGTYHLIAKNKTQKHILFVGKLLKVEYQLSLVEGDRWELRGI